MKADAKGPRRLAKELCRALADKKAEDLRVLDVSAISTITDLVILATGNSEPHLRALRIEVERILDETGTRIVGTDAFQDSGWVVVDAFNVMVHLFTTEQREHFDLESLWRAAANIPLSKLLSAPAPTAAAKPRRRRA